ncbi:hypothetical protein [Spiroplasma endosymbiont of Dasysyrphus albostriatus]|uniref:hypothetical protein n=1 Tax=Spiroplasma endosymbiont of Dasysyrphus albostriatus TaxID=3066299 RepID=UPI0030D58812
MDGNGTVFTKLLDSLIVLPASSSSSLSSSKGFVLTGLGVIWPEQMPLSLDAVLVRQWLNSWRDDSVLLSKSLYCGKL